MVQNKTSKTAALAVGLTCAAVNLVCMPVAVGQTAPVAPNGANTSTAVPTNGAAATPAPAAASTAPARRNTNARNAGSGGRTSSAVTVNFVNADIEAVTRAMGAMLNKQFIVDPRVKGQITVYSEQPMQVGQAYIQYLAALRGLGFTVVDSGGLSKVVPEADAKLQGGAVAIESMRKRGDQVLTQIFKLNHENPNNLVPVLRPLISPNNTINANASNQTLVITDYADNLQRIGKIIAAMDNPSSGDLEVIPLKHAVASDMAALVQRLAGGGGGAAGAVPGAAAPGGSGMSVLADPRNNTLMVQASSPGKMAQIRSIISRLDQPGLGVSGPGGNIWVVYLKNADATRLATVLRAAFANPGQGGAQGGGSTPSPTPQQPQQPQQQGGIGGQSTAAQQPLQAAAGVQTGGFIQADPSTNSLIITAAEPLYKQIRSVIDQLDSRRAQVMVESMIVKVDADKAAEIGFQWQGLLGKQGDKTLLGAGTNFGSGGNNIVTQGIGVAGAAGANGQITGSSLASSGLTVPGSGLNLGLVRSFAGIYTLASLARFLETNTGANVLSTPTLVSLDNEEAQIVIGQNVPFITGSFTNTGAGGASVNPFQTIERKDVGLTLRVKSQIGENGTIRMTIYQENSSVASTSGTAGPTTDKSAITTSVVVDDGQVMVLGGLLKDEYTDNDSKVPGLGDIPLAGNLFKAQGKRRVKSNLMVFLRPVVMRDAAAADAVTLDRYESIRAQQRNFQPLNGGAQDPNNPILPPIQQPSIVPQGMAPTRPPVNPVLPPNTSGEGVAPTAPAGTSPTPIKP
jgi:general secretion pathway protein D